MNDKHYQKALAQIEEITPFHMIVQNIDKMYTLGLTWGFTSANWYYDANKKVKKISEKYDCPAYIVAFVVSVTSVNNTWETNIEQSENLVRYYAENSYIDTTDTHDSNLASTYWPNRHKAVTALLYWKTGQEIDQKTLFSFLGVKTYNFAMNILHPESDDFVTLDGHATNLSLYGTNYRPLDKTPFSYSLKGLGLARYKVISKAYRLVAEKYNVSVHIIQSVTWETWRELGQRK